MAAGTRSSVLRALEFAIENGDKLKIDIINLSLGHPIYESRKRIHWSRPWRMQFAAGSSVVASAGNYGINQETGNVGYAGITSPGNAPSAVTVGATDTHDTVDHDDDTVALYSSRGPAWYSGLAKPDIVAPGSRLVAVGAYAGALYRDHPERRVSANRLERNPRYLRLSGTSMAAAVTSGVVALMVQANRRHDAPLTPNTVKAILEFTALPLTAADPLSQGAGALNGDGAVRLAEQIDPGVPVGTWWLEVRSHRGRCSTANRLRGRRHSCGAMPWLGQHRLREPHHVGADHRVGLDGGQGVGPGLGQHGSGLGRSLGLGSVPCWGNSSVTTSTGTTLGPTTIVWGNLADY